MNPLAIAVNGLMGGVVAHHHLPLRTEHFDPLVIAVNGPAAVVDGAQGAVGEAQGHHRRVQIAGLPDGRVYQGAPRGIELLDLVAGQVAGDVEVMDGHVQEDSTGGLHVLGGRRFGIPAGDADQVGRSDSAGSHGLPRLEKAGIETPVESDLQLHFVVPNGLQGAIDLLKIQGQRLLAEDVLSRRRRLPDQSGMSGRAGADDHRVDGGVLQNALGVRAGRGNPEIGGTALGSLQGDVHHGRQAGFRNAASQVVRVDAPDATGAEQAQVELSDQE